MEMANKKINQDDIKDMLEKTKDRLQKLGKETSIWIKKGEVELSRLSRMGKLEIEAMNISMKRDQLFKSIGRIIVEKKLGAAIEDANLRKMIEQAQELVKESERKKKDIASISKKFMKGAKGKTRGSAGPKKTRKKA